MDKRIRLNERDLSILMKAMNASTSVFEGTDEEEAALGLSRRLKKLVEGTYGKR